MRAALRLARRGLGSTWPNPAVGCVLVNERRIVGRGWTQPGGRPHAETEAIRRAGAAARGATAYVTLEPCSHHGRTAPCADALIAAGVARTVIAVGDPDPRVAGRGEAKLRQGGIDVTTGVLGDEATAINAGFFSRIGRGRPLITLKTASTLDGRIATAGGDSRWITGEDARRLVHRLRADHDAVIVGSGTAIADDPDLSCRLPGLEARSPLRIVLDGRLRLPATATLSTTAGRRPTWVMTAAAAGGTHRDALTAAGVTIIDVDADGAGHPEPGAVVAELGRRGLTRVLLEGGGRVAASYLAAGLVDRLVWFHAPRIIGGDGVPAVTSIGVTELERAPSFARTRLEAVATDVVAIYERMG